MRYALTFIGALVLVAGLGIALRVAFTGDGVHEHEPSAAHDEHEHEDASHGANDAHDHAGHDHASEAENGWGGTHRHDLANTRDPVSGAEVGEDHSKHAHAVYHGYLIHFADDDTMARFRRAPIRWLRNLELEMTADGEVHKVNASEYRTAPMPEFCPFCEMEMVNVDDVYILHRGFRIHFGCWGGCAESFLSDPQSYYAEYGLVERNGELVLKE